MRSFTDILDEWCAPRGEVSLVPHLQRKGRVALEELSRFCDGELFNHGDKNSCWPNDYSSFRVLGGLSGDGPKPSHDMVISDMRAAEGADFFDFANLEYAGEEVGVLDVMASTLRQASRGRLTRLYGALSICSTPGGLDVASLRAAPHDEEQETCRMDYSPWLTSYLPSGAILHPMLDNVGCSSYVNHLFGEAIYVFWPSTQTNLDAFSAFHEKAVSDEKLIECLDDLDNVEFFHVTSPTAFSVKPGIIRAVISLYATAFTTKRYWHWATVEDALRGIKWGVDWLRDYDDGNVTAGAIDDHQSLLEVDIGMLMGLTLSRPDGDGWKETARETLDHCRRRLTTLRGARRIRRNAFI